MRLFILGTGLMAKELSALAEDMDRAQFVNLVHPSSTILPRTTLGAGTVFSTGVLVASHTTVGNHVFLNRARARVSIAPSGAGVEARAVPAAAAPGSGVAV